MRFEILTEVRPEPDPQKTTGDQSERIELIVGWAGKPSEETMRKFEAKFPIHFYDTFHCHNYDFDDLPPEVEFGEDFTAAPPRD